MKLRIDGREKLAKRGALDKDIVEKLEIGGVNKKMINHWDLIMIQ